MILVDVPNWVLGRDASYFSVNLNVRNLKEGLGYICDSELIMENHIRLETEQGKCHYLLKANDSQPWLLQTLTVYVCEVHEPSLLSMNFM